MTDIIPIDKLGAFPILQLAAAILIVLFGGVSVWRALNKAPDQPVQQPAQQRDRTPEQRWYFEGPIAEVFKQLALIGQQQARALDRFETFIEGQKRTNELLEEIGRELHDMPSSARRR